MAAPITIPTRYTFGNTSGWKFFAIVKLLLGGVQPIYFSTQKNVTTSLTLKYLGNTITTSSDLFYSDKLAASTVDKDGNETEYDGIGEVDYSINVQDGGGLASRNVASLTFINRSDTFSWDEFLAQFDIENGEVEIWEGYLPDAPETFEITSNMVLRFKGVISSSQEYDYQTLSLRCIDSRHLDSIFLPKVKITPASFPHRPKEVDGQPLPIVVGDFYTNINVANEVYDLAPTIATDDINPKFYVSDHPVGTTGGIYYASNDGLFGTFNINQTHPTLSGSFPQIIDDGTGRTNVEFGIGTPTADFIIRPKVRGDEVNVGTGVIPADHANAIDADSTTYVTLVPTAGTGSQLILQHEHFQDPGALIAAMNENGTADTRAFSSGGYKDFYILAILGNITGSPKLQRRRLSGASSLGWTDVYTFASGGGILGGDSFIIYDLISVIGLPLTWDLFRDYQWRIDCVTGAPTAGCRVKEIYFGVRSYVDSAKKFDYIRPSYFRTTSPTNVKLRDYFAASKLRASSRVLVQAYGAKYGNWITGRGYTAGAAIQNPALFIEWLLREEMNIADERIDTGSFDDAATARSTWYIASSIREMKRSEEHIRQICFEFGLILQLLPDSVTGEDRYTLIALPSDADTAAFDINQNAILWTDKPEISISYTSGEKIINDFYVKYFVDYSSGDTQKSLYISDTTGTGVMSNNLSADSGAIRGNSYTNWLTSSQSRNRTRNPFEVSLDYVRSADTAEKFLKLYADWWAFKRQIVTCKILFTPENATLKVGNIVNFNVDIVGIYYQLTVKYIVTKLNFPPFGKTKEPYITMECEEIPNALTGQTVMTSISGKWRTV